MELAVTDNIHSIIDDSISQLHSSAQTYKAAFFFLISRIFIRFPIFT